MTMRYRVRSWVGTTTPLPSLDATTDNARAAAEDAAARAREYGTWDDVSVTDVETMQTLRGEQLRKWAEIATT